MSLETERKILEIPKYTSMSTEQLFILCNAYWVYSRKPGEPHAVLTSNLHSDGYFNVSEALKYPNIRKIFACRLAAQLECAGIKKENVDLIVSSSYAAFPFGQELSSAIVVPSVYTEKTENGQKWTGRFGISSGARVLHAEELVTTSGTTLRVSEAILEAEKNPFRFVEINGKAVVATIIHRPSKLPIKYEKHIIVALIEKEVHNWKPEECPLCKAGSEALKPKPNWAKFAQFAKL